MCSIFSMDNCSSTVAFQMHFEFAPFGGLIHTGGTKGTVKIVAAFCAFLQLRVWLTFLNCDVSRAFSHNSVQLQCNTAMPETVVLIRLS